MATPEELTTLSVPYTISNGKSGGRTPINDKYMPTFTLLPTLEDFDTLHKEYQDTIANNGYYYRQIPDFRIRLLIGSLHYILIISKKSCPMFSNKIIYKDTYHIQHEASQKEGFAHFQFREEFETYHDAIKFIKTHIQNEVKELSTQLRHLQRILEY